MEEVSARIFAFYSEVVARQGVRLEDLVAGLASLERVLDGASWYDWTDHVRLLERFQAVLGGPAAADEAALTAVEIGASEALRGLARTVADAKLLYRAGFWFGSSLYRHVASSVRSEGRLLRIVVEVPPDYEGSEIFFRMWRGTLRGAPRLLRLPDATVTSEITSHRGVFNVLVPEGHNFVSRARRVLRLAQTSSMLIRQLETHEQELRAAYDSLLRSRQDFREIAHNTPDALLLLRNGTIVYANPAAATAIGTGRLVDSIEPADRGLVTAWLAEAEALGSAGRLDFRVRGRTFEAEAAHSVDFSGHGAILVLARDVSERQASEDRLRRSERDNRGLLEAVPDIIVRITAEGTIASVAGQASHPIAALLRRRVGASFESLEEELVDLPDDLGSVLAAGAAAARPEAFVLETAVRLDEELLHLEWRSVAIEGGGTVCLVRDRSQQRQTEAELAVAERLASLGMLAAGVGHEINNPLTYVLLQLRLIERAVAEGRTAADLDEHVRAALEGAGHIERVVRALKALAQRVPENHRPVDVNAVVEQIVRLTENRVPAGTRVLRDYEDEVFALADEGPLGTVIGNLFVNAADAVAKVGGVGEIVIATRTRRESIVIEVSDSGVGMTDSATRKAFDPFFTTKSLSGGLGLGLTLAHRMVTALGGTITVARRVEGGTTMTVRLPRAPPHQRPSTAPPRSLPRFRGVSVLVADDQPNLVATLRMLLDECSVLGVSRGEAALAAVAQRDFDFVLCDIVMPDLDGLGIYERLEREAPHILDRLVFMTGGATRPAIADFLARIPNACLQKPFSEAQLRDCMAATMGADALQSAAGSASM